MANETLERTSENGEQEDHEAGLIAEKFSL